MKKAFFIQGILVILLSLSSSAGQESLYGPGLSIPETSAIYSVGFEEALPSDYWNDRLLILCYHDIPDVAERDPFAVELTRFVQHIEFLLSEGHNFVSMEQVVAWIEEGVSLPFRPVLLTFDDGFRSYGYNIVPVLEVYEIPSVFGVISYWTENPDEAEIIYGENMPPLHTWEELHTLAKHPLVELAGHSHHMHHAQLANPYGSTGPFVTNFTYLPEEGRYWTESEYDEIILADLKENHRMIEEKTGKAPRVIVWPFGAYNLRAVELAKKAGFPYGYSLDKGYYEPGKEGHMPRVMIHANMSLKDFANSYRRAFTYAEQKRIIHADLDYIYDEDPEVFMRNVDAFIERIFEIHPTTVYLQAFADPSGDGTVSQVYFENDYLPVRANIFGFISRAIQIRGIQVFAWMPILSYEFPDENFTRRNRVHSRVDGVIAPSDSWYRRLSPFSPEAGEKISALYRQMAQRADVNGIVFQDDGYLAADEDFHPAAIRSAREWIGVDITQAELSKEDQQKWQDLKTRQLNKFAQHLAEQIKYYRPDAKDARTLYAPVVTHPESEEWLSQNYSKSLEYHDWVVLMAYPELEKASRPNAWLETLVQKAKQMDPNLEKTVFKTQAVDWNLSGSSREIDTARILQRLEVLLFSGAHHVGYYPDDFIRNHPKAKRIKTIMSSRIFPFLP